MSSNAKTQYPCPTCVGTMLPGITYSFPRDDSKLLRGAGKLWYPYTGAASAYAPPSTLGDCYTCHGSGVVKDRRSGRSRRSGDDGRRETDSYMGALRNRARTRKRNGV